MFNKKGFTLIELLVVVLLIGVLSGIALSVIDPRGIRAKARDAQRIGDLKTIQVALETYYSDNRAYPSAANYTVVSSALSALIPDYINELPSDPLGGSVSETCDSYSVTSYAYYYKSDGNTYTLLSILEIATSGSDDTSYCETVTNPL